jgi:adenylosuccinate synthase
VVLRYAAAVNGFTEFTITKLDILSGFDELKLCVAYEIDAQRVDTLPATNAELARAIPIYETLPGWQEDVRDARHVGDLPANAAAYVQRISELTDTPVKVVSVGPEREQLVVL